MLDVLKSSEKFKGLNSVGVVFQDEKSNPVYKVLHRAWSCAYFWESCVLQCNSQMVTMFHLSSCFTWKTGKDEGRKKGEKEGGRKRGVREGRKEGKAKEGRGNIQSHQTPVFFTSIFP